MSAEQVRQRARLFSARVAAGHTPARGEFAALIAAARVGGLLDDPDVITASQWQDWLHPRGKDGKFILKNSWVNIFADPNARLSDPHAQRMRAKIDRLTPHGAEVTYYDAIHPGPDGSPRRLTQGELDESQYPTVIPVNQLAKKVATAPQPKATLPNAPLIHRQQTLGQSHQDEYSAGALGDRYAPAKTLEQWTSEIGTFNEQIMGDTALAEKFGDQEAVVRPDQGTPISDADFAKHQEYVAAITDRGMKAGLGLDGALKDSYGMWSDEAGQLFEDLVHQAFLAKTANQTKPRDHRSIMLGGLPGAGKSSTLDRMGKAHMLNEDDWIITNPDDFKDMLLEQGKFPQITGLTPAETSSFIHEASSEMNHMMEQLLLSEGYNVVFDITMGGKHSRDRNAEEAAWVQRLVQDLKAKHGYQVDGLFVDVPPKTSRERVDLRHKQGLDALRTGQITRRDGTVDTTSPVITFGGRTVPEDVIAKNVLDKNDPLAKEFNSQNAVNFNGMKDVFTRWAVWDNSSDDGEPVFVTGTAKNMADISQMPGYYAPGVPLVPGESAPEVVPGELQPEEGI